jgi:hypothetical protein
LFVGDAISTDIKSSGKDPKQKATSEILFSLSHVWLPYQVMNMNISVKLLLGFLSICFRCLFYSKKMYANMDSDFQTFTETHNPFQQLKNEKEGKE